MPRPVTVESMRAAPRNAAAREQCRAATARAYAETSNRAFNLGLADECDRWARVFADMADAPLAPAANPER